METCGIGVFKTAREHFFSMSALKYHKKKDGYGLVPLE